MPSTAADGKQYLFDAVTISLPSQKKKQAAQFDPDVPSIILLSSVFFSLSLSIKAASGIDCVSGGCAGAGLTGWAATLLLVIGLARGFL